MIYMKLILTIASLVPFIALAIVARDWNAKAEAAHVNGLIAAGGLLWWAVWITVSVTWLVWR